LSLQLPRRKEACHLKLENCRSFVSASSSSTLLFGYCRIDIGVSGARCSVLYLIKVADVAIGPGELMGIGTLIGGVLPLEELSRLTNLGER